MRKTAIRAEMRNFMFEASGSFSFHILGYRNDRSRIGSSTTSVRAFARSKSGGFLPTPPASCSSRGKVLRLRVSSGEVTIRSRGVETIRVRSFEIVDTIDDNSNDLRLT